MPEVEIKFDCPPDAIEAVLLRVLHAPPHDRALLSVYYDTPDEALAAVGASLRLRSEASGRTVQTLKTGQGLAREEVEAEVAPGHLDLSWPQLAGLGLAALGPDPLAPRFSVHVRRRSGVVEAGGSRIEAAFDEGEIRAGDRRAVVCEVELELLEGEREDLITLARRLAAELPLTLSLRTKSARGSDLAADRPWPRAGQVALAGGITAGEALRQALLGSLAEVAGRTRDTANDPSVEAVHQMRVALRRMRSLALVFRRRLDEAPAATVRAGLRDLAQACGEVRELDVLMAMGPAGPALDTALSEARHRAAAGLSAGLAAAPARLTLLEGLLLAETGDWPGLARNAEGAAEGLGSDLERRWRRIRREGLDADALEPEDLHALRLHIKAFRYALAAFECQDWRRAAPGFEAALRKAQDALGLLNDAGMAEGVLSRLDLDPEGRRAARRFISGLRRQGDARRALKAVDELVTGPALHFT
ncbi:MAG: CHAD domain-containing protein [Phenylobacterium sp.]